LRLAAINFPNGQRSTFTYFPNSKDQLLHQITHFKPDSSPLSRFTYDYNSLRQVTEWTQERGAANPLQWTFGYDAADQLTNAVAIQASATVDSFAWKLDGAGNRTDEIGFGTARKSFFNALNEVVGLTNAPLQTNTCEWDAEGRLVAFSRATHRSEFSYDGYGRRTRIVEKENGNVVSDRRYLWCAFNLCEERDASGAVVLKRFSSHGVRAESGADIPAGTYFVTRDGLDSIRDLTDASGAVRAQYAYTPFGQRTRVAGDLDSDFGFTGHFRHRASGLDLAMYRAYDSSLGRWLSRDPLGEGDDLNLYGYAYNDPVNYFDPLGLQNAANKLGQNLQGQKDAQAGLDALKKGQKALDVAEKLVEKGAKGTVKDLVEKQRQDAIKKLKPSPPRESYQDTVEKMGDTAKASSERLSIPQQNAGNEIVKNLGQGSTSCSGSSSKTSSKTSTPAKEKETSFWDWVFGSDTPEPPKPIEQKSDTYWKAKAAQGSTYE
jgi:RHS repeat-associated protein